jgi:hypothetical protein
MTESERDAGVIQVLLERFEKHRLPRALALKDKVDKGDLLDERDTRYLEGVLEDAQEVKSLVHKHPEYRDLYMRAVQLYKEITEKALENAKGSQGAG